MTLGLVATFDDIAVASCQVSANSIQRFEDVKS